MRLKFCKELRGLGFTTFKGEDATKQKRQPQRLGEHQEYGFRMAKTEPGRRAASVTSYRKAKEENEGLGRSLDLELRGQE